MRDPSEIAEGWGRYFENLYGAVNNDHYDSEFYDEVNQKLESILRSNPDTENLREITTDELKIALRGLKNGKMCGLDGIYNEHLLIGGDELSDLILNLFNDMYVNSYVPPSKGFDMVYSST